ncbi:MAG: transcriptional regulator FtrA [Longimicrobiales bacterium]
MTRDPLNAIVLAYDGLCTFEFGVVIELFGLPRPEFERWYRLRVAAVDSGPLMASGGISVQAPYSLRILDSAGTIIVPGWRGADAPVPPLLKRKLRRAYTQGARILSVCSGAFVLAAAGLLDGKRAATHWRYAAALQRRFPLVTVDSDVLYVDEGSIITSAGSAAGIDMGLHLIRRDFGSDVANAVARRLVVPPHRDGGQKQFVQSPVAEAESESAFNRVLESITANLAEHHSVASMAKRSNMSKRTFARHFAAVTGTTPHRWLQSQRARRAQQLLETTALSVDQVARHAGFNDAQLLRIHFKRVVGTSPTNYRRTFSPVGTTPG